MDALGPHDPRLLGDFTLLARIGAGGMGEVYLGRSSTGRLAAVKVINEAFSRDPVFRERFEREVGAARLVSGAFTAPVVGADTTAERPWMATLYVQGASLQHAVDRGGPYRWEQVITLAASIGEALENVHSVGIIHRDLKPANVLMAQDGPRVIDFGIAQAGNDSSLTRTGLVTGSPEFMSPEQVSRRPVTVASDVFALGSLMHFAATGRSAFGGGDALAVMYGIVNEEPDLSALEDPALRSLVEMCLTKDPEKRPSSGQVRADAVTILQTRQDVMESSDLYRPGLINDDLDIWLHRPVAEPVMLEATETTQPIQTSPVSPLPFQYQGSPTPTEVNDAALTQVLRVEPQRAPRRKGWLAGLGAALALVTAGAAVVVVTQSGGHEPIKAQDVSSTGSHSSTSAGVTPSGSDGPRPGSDTGQGGGAEEAEETESGSDRPVTPEDAMALTESEAETELGLQADESRSAEEDLLGRWVPQLSGKCKGIEVDIRPGWAADGTDDVERVNNRQILAFHLALADRWDAVTVRPRSLGLTSNYGGGRCAGQPLWVSLVPGRFRGWKQVLTWCAERGFPKTECEAVRVSGENGDAKRKQRK